MCMKREVRKKWKIIFTWLTFSDCTKWVSAYKTIETPFNIQDGQAENPIFIGRKKLRSGGLFPGTVFGTTSLFHGPCMSNIE